MRANISINNEGVILTPSDRLPPVGGLFVARINQQIAITLDKKPTTIALLSLIRTLRAIRGTITLTHSASNEASDPASDHTSASACVYLADMALRGLEFDHQPLFKSQIEIITPNSLTLDALPENLFHLARLIFNNADTTSPFMKAMDANIKDLVLVGQNLSMNLCFISIPETLAWPTPKPMTSQSLDVCLPYPVNLWFFIVYELALSIRNPIHHYGTIETGDGHPKRFQRLIYPVVSDQDRANNYQILSTAIFNDDPEASLI